MTDYGSPETRTELLNQVYGELLPYKYNTCTQFTQTNSGQAVFTSTDKFAVVLQIRPKKHTARGAALGHAIDFYLRLFSEKFTGGSRDFTQKTVYQRVNKDGTVQPFHPGTLAVVTHKVEMDYRKTLENRRRADEAYKAKTRAEAAARESGRQFVQALGIQSLPGFSAMRSENGTILVSFTSYVSPAVAQSVYAAIRNALD
jgi:hypothetical protein